MKKLSVGLATLAGVALLAGPARAQIPHITPFSFEARAGVALPQGDFNNAANPGFTVGGSVTYHAIPVIGIYGGYSYAQFDAEGSSGEFKDSGFDAGVRVGIPTPLIPIDPWIKGGVVVHNLEVSGTATSIDDGWSTGVEVGAGLGFGFGPLSLTPGVSWVHHGDVSYVRGDVGVRIRL